MDTPEFIVRVLMEHPAPTLVQDPEVEKVKKSIKDAYRENKKSLRFTEAEMKAKCDWLRAFLDGQ